MNDKLNNKTAKGWRKRRIADKVEELNVMTVSTVTVDDYNDTTKQAFIRCPICYDQPREWVGLTDEEIKHAPHHMVDGAYHYSFKQGAEWAEAKLRSKNT